MALALPQHIQVLGPSNSCSGLVIWLSPTYFREGLGDSTKHALRASALATEQHHAGHKGHYSGLGVDPTPAAWGESRAPVLSLDGQETGNLIRALGLWEHWIMVTTNQTNE